MAANKRSVRGAPPKQCTRYPLWSLWGAWRGVSRPNITAIDAGIESARALTLAHECRVLFANARP